jgi:ABC-type Fe3+-hydroxamate transport system substrate-binding protein
MTEPDHTRLEKAGKKGFPFQKPGGRPMIIQDALGRTLRFEKSPETVVSLIPSITETLFACGLDREIVGVTDYCIYPEAELKGKKRVGGPKSIDVRKITKLRPGLVVANYEENDKAQVEKLIEKGLNVMVTYPRTVDDALTLMLELGWLLGKIVRASDLVEEIRQAVTSMQAPENRKKVLCPVWKDPYMSFGGETFCSNLIDVCGGDNIFAGRRDPYFEFSLDEAQALQPDAILLPSEPYAFGEADAALFRKAFPGAAEKGGVHLVAGELVTWFGVRMKKALEVLPGLLA